MSNPLYAAVVLLTAFSGVAYAGDDDPFDDDDKEQPAPPPPADDDEPFDEDDSKADETKATETGVDLLEGEETAPAGEGQDTETIYRAQLAALKGMEADEELQEWEAYLETYPNSRFKDRIDTRMADLEDAMYKRTPNGTDGADAKDAEIDLAVPLQLDPINPRQSMQAGFEWGLPDYINLFVAYEHPLRRDLSARVGFRHRYTGWRLETGMKYAFVKSTRTQTVATAMFDLHLNTLPAYPVIRPQLAVGHKFGDLLDAQIQGGIELDTRGKAGVRPIGGANVTFNASETVKVFVETALYMQSLESPKGGLFYRFNTVNFGLKFLPAGKGIEPGQVEVNLGASAPYTSNYWSFHYGSIMTQVNYYFE